ncbi:hypothetical protein CL614_00680 [archaeon]|nr:hypothetical protein [archaeon]|tara:strand:- start:678 stop:1061 length:384 start_codon:yes stop_codon:yes gene_type:complete
MNRTVANENVRKMLDKMGDHLLHESMGGNAGDYHGIPCQAANFSFNKFSGDINEFTNYRRDPDLARGTFHIACPNAGPSYVVLEFIPITDYSSAANIAIKDTIKLYNRFNRIKYWKKVDQTSTTHSE